MKLFKEFVEDSEVDERELTGKELKDREHNVKRLKKHLGKFKDRYGKDGESIMYAIATRDAKRDKKYEDLELDEALPKSTMYGVVVKGKVIAKGSKAAMRKLAKQKGGHVLNSPAAKVGDSIVSKDGIKTLVKKPVKEYAYGPLDTMRPMPDLGDIPNYYGTKLNAQIKKKKVKRNA